MRVEATSMAGDEARQVDAQHRVGDAGEGRVGDPMLVERPQVDAEPLKKEMLSESRPFGLVVCYAGGRKFPIAASLSAWMSCA